MVNLGDTFKYGGLMWEVQEVLNYKVIAVVINGDKECAFMKEEVESLITSTKQRAPINRSLEPGTYLVTVEVITIDTLHMNVDEEENKTIGQLIEDTEEAVRSITPIPIVKVKATRITKASGAPVYSDD